MLKFTLAHVLPDETEHNPFWVTWTSGRHMEASTPAAVARLNLAGVKCLQESNASLQSFRRSCQPQSSAFDASGTQAPVFVGGKTEITSPPVPASPVYFPFLFSPYIASVQ